MATLDVWMNGQRVGEWTTRRSGNSTFHYAQSWTEGPDARLLSLSLPITADREIRGPVVDHYFDNLLPDNADIRRRIRDRFQLRSGDAFELLAQIGRDCVGAVQLLPPGEDAGDWQRIEAIPLSSADVARILRQTTTPAPFDRQEP
ncbi:MAG: HipA N-terminal domain-containing protein, partial [Proteobacteria bacterium]|nr:HipA N-terminal domain-containing protein [Pseudomonadota bacterium]